MSTPTFQKWCASILFVIGILWISGAVLEYLAGRFGTDTALAGQALRLVWAVLLVFGLLAVYHFDLERNGRMGLLAFATAMIGTILSVIPEYLRLSSLAGSSGATLELYTTSPIQRIVIYVYLLGYVWFGITMLLLGSSSKLGAIALTLGIVLEAIPLVFEHAPIVLLLPAAFFGGMGLLLLGLSLLRKKIVPSG